MGCGTSKPKAISPVPLPISHTPTKKPQNSVLRKTKWTDEERKDLITEVRKVVDSIDHGKWNDEPWVEEHEKGYRWKYKCAEGYIKEVVRFYLLPFRDLCQHVLSNPEYRLNEKIGNDVSFIVTPWYSKYKRDFKDGRPIDFIGDSFFNTGLGGADYFTRVPSFGTLGQEQANEYYHELITRTWSFQTELDGGTVPWDEMPLGVIKRDVCSESQDPNYNKRAPMSTERMRTKRAQLCRKLARNVTNTMSAWTIYKRRYDDVSSNNSVARKMEYSDVEKLTMEHMERWVNIMDNDWIEFHALVK